MRVQRLHRRRLGGRRRLDGTGHSFTDLHVRLRDMAEMSSLCSRCVCVARDWSRGQGVLASTEIRGFRTAHFDSPVCAPRTLDSPLHKDQGPLTAYSCPWNMETLRSRYPVPGWGRARAGLRPRPRSGVPPRVSAAPCVLAFSPVRVPRLHSPLPLSPAAPASATCPPRVVPRLVHSKRPHNITATKRSVVYYKNLVRVRVRVRVSS